MARLPNCKNCGKGLQYAKIRDTNRVMKSVKTEVPINIDNGDKRMMGEIRMCPNCQMVYIITTTYETFHEDPKPF